ncbi:CAP domain-containing protein [Demequina sp. NBRC 110051]|uniref:CAP domain-containing protein n=1 Tax=Demequina sp. NBRC 110051 TaxID=1570340 RepID=UPI0009FCC241|nr:CAP domain-containing protein [Demequina sp. NBRC 110051]
MTETQEVLDPRRPRRRAIHVFLLGMIPLAVASTAGAAAGEYLPSPEPAPVNLAVEDTSNADETPEPDITAGIVAPGTVANVDVAASVQAIKVTVPEPEPVVEAPAPVVKQASTGAQKAPAPATKATKATTKQTTPQQTTTQKSTESTTKATTTTTTKKSSGTTFQQYCSSPKSPYSASGGAKALMAAANKERARIGIAPLTWSSSLASAATSWSQSMATKDGQTDATMDALAHNPNRPGAENVAVSSSTGGVSESAAHNRAHSGWMYSNGHCLNLMNPAYTQMGAGSAATPDGTTRYTTANYR